MKVESNMGYFLDDYTFTPFRNQGFHTWSIQERIRLCIKQDMKTLKAHVLAYNTFSLNSYLKAGFEVVKSIHFYRFGKWIIKHEINRRKH